MKPLLLGLAGGLIGAGVLALIAWWWFRRRLRRLAEGLGEIITGVPSSVPPFRVTLQFTTEPEWADLPVVNRVTAELERNGYQKAGDFIIPEQNEMPLRGFTHPQSGVLVALYENPADDLLVADFVAFFEDDANFTVSNAPETGLQRPPYAELRPITANLHANPLAVVELHEALEQACKGRRTARVTTDTFVEYFIDSWARTMDWHVERGGITPNEVRRNATLAGQPAPDDEAVEHIRAAWTAAIRDFVEDRIQDRFLRTGTMDAAEWEDKRDRVRFIHERMNLRELINTLAWDIVERHSHVEDEDEESEHAEEKRLGLATESLRHAFNGAGIRDGFRAAQPLLPENMQWQYVCKVAGDYPADVYLTPEDADAYEDDFD